MYKTTARMLINRPSLVFVASLFEDQPVLVDISKAKPSIRVLPSAPKREPMNDPDYNKKQASQDAKQSTCITIFSSTGSHILAGTNKGWLNIIQTKSCETIHSTRLCNGFLIYLRLAASGSDMVSNASDRVIRTIHVPDLSQPNLDVENMKVEVEHKFQDVVNRLAWNHVTFSSTGEYVTASTFMNHDVYVWERNHGSLVKILEGPKEELSVVEVRLVCSSICLSHSNPFCQVAPSSASSSCVWNRDWPHLPLVNHHPTALVGSGSRFCRGRRECGIR